LDLSTTIACIQGFHTIAAYFGGPAWLMNDEDSKAYAVAVNNALRHHDIAVAQKTIDYCNLAALTLYFEGTRWMAMRQPQPRQPMSAGPAQIFQFATPPPAPTAAPPVADVYGPSMPPPEGLH
jgi:hypothetical protein